MNEGEGVGIRREKGNWIMGKWERQSCGLNQIDKLSFMVSGMCVW